MRGAEETDSLLERLWVDSLIIAILLGCDYCSTTGPALGGPSLMGDLQNDDGRIPACGVQLGVGGMFRGWP